MRTTSLISIMQPYQSDRLATYRGRAILVVQSKDLEGQAEILVSGEGLKPAAAGLRIHEHKKSNSVISK